MRMLPFLRFLNAAQAGDAPQADDVARLGEALFNLQYQGGAAGHQRASSP